MSALVWSMAHFLTLLDMRRESGLKRRLRYALGPCVVAAGVFFLTAFSGPASAEMYVAGQVGVTLANDLFNVNGTGPNQGVSFSDTSLQDSFMYGAKLGYYFESMKWLGLETEVFNTNPNIKQQSMTATGPGGSSTFPNPGANLRVLNWSPITVVMRYQAGRFEPYAGVGMGVYFVHLSSGGESTSDTNVGLNTQLGLRYKVTQNLSMFGEWKTNRVKFHFDASSPNGNAGGFKADYGVNLLAFGISYHF
jgi:opacity protein-like surface antigen